MGGKPTPNHKPQAETKVQYFKQLPDEMAKRPAKTEEFLN